MSVLCSLRSTSKGIYSRGVHWVSLIFSNLLIHLQPLEMLFSKTFLPILSVSLVGLVKVAYAVTTSVHDDTFFPDAILRITEAKIKQSCVPSKETLLVNGTSPGPKLKFTEGKTVWIRVYNDVHNQNLTMVRPLHHLFLSCTYQAHTLVVGLKCS